MTAASSDLPSATEVSAMATSDMARALDGLALALERAAEQAVAKITARPDVLSFEWGEYRGGITARVWMTDDRLIEGWAGTAGGKLDVLADLESRLT